MSEQYKEYLRKSEFRDTLGAEVTVDGKPYRRYSVFGRPGSGNRIVVILNEDSQKPITAKFKLDGATKDLFVVTPEDTVPKAVSDTLTIPARSAVVLLEGWHE